MPRQITLVAERGLPFTLAGQVADEVREAVSAATGEPVRLECTGGALTLDDDGEIHLSHSIAATADKSDLVLFFTELPRLEHGRPAPAEIDTERSAGIISIPACGTVALPQRVAHLSIACLAGLLAGDTDDAAFRSAESRRRRWHIDDERQGKRTLVAASRWGWALLVMGMMRVNRPWRLVSTLKGVIAAAAATASFGIFYTSIWQMATTIHPWRLVLITAFAVTLMATWLIVANRLWESGGGRAVWNRLYNTVTVCTVLTGVATMYVGLYLLTFVAGLVVIDTGFMTEKIGRPAALSSFLLLAWLATSMGIVAGALGSSTDSYDAILRATFGERERERRKRQSEQEDPQDERGR
ncbi:hypothetical protein [Tomitella cavernea]|uniref:hypothetical protein n=1 Tax=Tomitella cavernea TaxID=1387982 RepID=UPI001902E00D|nr:hypothetical protein [Tomitella cavernea]